MENQWFECAGCDRTFHQKYELISHWLIYHNFSRFPYEICQWCTEIFKDSNSFNLHQSEVHEKNGVPAKYYQCDQCTVSNVSLKRIQDHYRLKHQLKNYMPYKCSDCGKKYEILDEFLNHQVNAHQKEYPRYACTMCPSVFHDKTMFLVHENTHGLTNFLHLCRFCDEGFVTRSEFVTHYALKHPKQVRTIHIYALKK